MISVSILGNMALLNGDACCVLETTLQLVDFAFQVKHRSAVNGWLWFAFFMPAKARLMLVTGCLDNSGLSTCTSNFSPMSSSHVLLSILPDASPFHGSFGPMCFFLVLTFHMLGTCCAADISITYICTSVYSYFYSTCSFCLHVDETLHPALLHYCGSLLASNILALYMFHCMIAAAGLGALASL